MTRRFTAAAPAAMAASMLLLAAVPSVSGLELVAWQGEYRGFIDGRKATLNISYSSINCEDSVTGVRSGSAAVFSIDLTDLERNVHWSRDCIYAFGADAPGAGRDGERHIWRDLKLRNVETRAIENAGTFLLHTWNTAFISGFNHYRDKAYGRLFIRADVTIPTCVAGTTVAAGTCRF